LAVVDYSVDLEAAAAEICWSKPRSEFISNQTFAGNIPQARPVERDRPLGLMLLNSANAGNTDPGSYHWSG
jgi:hypothetical protein